MLLPPPTLPSSAARICCWFWYSIGPVVLPWSIPPEITCLRADTMALCSSTRLWTKLFNEEASILFYSIVLFSSQEKLGLYVLRKMTWGKFWMEVMGIYWEKKWADCSWPARGNNRGMWRKKTLWGPLVTVCKQMIYVGMGYDFWGDIGQQWSDGVLT